MLLLVVSLMHLRQLSCRINAPAGNSDQTPGIQVEQGRGGQDEVETRWGESLTLLRHP